MPTSRKFRCIDHIAEKYKYPDRMWRIGHAPADTSRTHGFQTHHQKTRKEPSKRGSKRRSRRDGSDPLLARTQCCPTIPSRREREGNRLGMNLMLLVHFSRSDPSVEEALYDVSAIRPESEGLHATNRLSWACFVTGLPS